MWRGGIVEGIARMPRPGQGVDPHDLTVMRIGQLRSKCTDVISAAISQDTFEFSIITAVDTIPSPIAVIEPGAAISGTEQECAVWCKAQRIGTVRTRRDRDTAAVLFP